MNTPAEERVPAQHRADGIPAASWTPRLIISLISLCLLLEVTASSSAMTAFAIPAISQHFHTAQGAWAVAATLLSGAVLSPLVGKLADMYGKRRLLLLVMLVATVGSVVSALAPSYFLFVLGRVLQGLIGTTLFLVYSLIRDVFPRNKVAVAMSLSMAGLSIFTTASPYLTAWILDVWGLRAIYWMTACALVVLAGFITASTAETRVRVRSRLDFVGAALLGIGLAGILIGVTFGPTWGWTAKGTLAGFVIGIVALTAWVVSANRFADPLVDLRLFRKRAVTLTAVTASCGYACAQALFVLLPMVCMTPAVLGLGYGLGLDGFGFAPVLAVYGFANMVGGITVAKLVNGFPARRLMGAGLSIAGLGALLITLSHQQFALLLLFSFIAGYGQGIILASVPNLIVAAVPAEQQASIAGLVNVFTLTGAAALPAVAYAVLNSNVALVADGEVFSTSTGVTLAFLLPTVAAFFGAALAVFVPWRQMQQSPTPPGVEDEGGSESELVHAQS
ncbi:MFS transporter [Rhodococcus koreensis]